MDARELIVRPVVTEKTNRLMSEENVYTFVVNKSANKEAVRLAIREIYGVKVEKVNIVNVHSKPKRVGKYSGETVAYKKAIVKLAEGQSIDIFDQE